MSQKIFFHVGLSKTGSTFLQHQVFPKLKGIYYLPTLKYRHALKLLPKIHDERVLVSREFDQQFEQEVKKFSAQYPQAYPIIVLREHSNWAVSNYKRFVKNGHAISFKEFIDIERDKGLFKKIDFDYERYIDLLEQYFAQKPLILFYEDLQKEPFKFVRKIMDYTGAELSYSDVNWNPRHVSYDIDSLKLVRTLSNKIQFQKKLEVHIKPRGFLYNLYANIVRYSILYASKLFPKSWFPTEEFINPAEIEELRQYFSPQWDSLRNKTH